MSLFGALTTADAGLAAQQAAIGNISQNVANSQTIGYKGVGTSFQELVTNSSQNYNSPGGVVASPVYQNNIAGTLASSQTATNLAISGNGFFAVAQPTSTGTTAAPNTAATFYTRRGDFQLDQNDYLVNGAGDYLMGYQVDPASNTVNTSSLKPIQVSNLVNAPVATSTVTLAANLPSGTAAGTSISPTTVSVYDPLGVAHTMSIQFAPALNAAVPPAAIPNKWTANISTPGLQGAATSGSYQLTLTFADGTNTTTLPDGSLAFPAGALQSITDTTPASTPTNPSPYPAGTAMTVPTAAQSASQASAKVTIPFTDANGVVQNISLNFGTFGGSSGLTQYSGTSVAVQSLTANGAAQGTFSNISIDNNGYVSLNYTNGNSLKYFQVPVAQFNASQNLQALSGETYAQTSTSGQAQLSVSGANGAGTITASSLEQSNVDIATQFTNLIVAQEAYTANTKVVSTANQLITALLQVVA